MVSRNFFAMVLIFKSERVFKRIILKNGSANKAGFRESQHWRGNMYWALGIGNQRMNSSHSLHPISGLFGDTLVRDGIVKMCCDTQPSVTSARKSQVAWGQNTTMFALCLPGLIFLSFLQHPWIFHFKKPHKLWSQAPFSRLSDSNQTCTMLGTQRPSP